MSKIKSLILGSAATLVAVAGAQAADLPVKAKAVQYVKVCSLYGAGFYYIPGTDTCIKLGGYIQADYNINGNNYDNPGGIGAISTAGAIPAGVSGTHSRDSAYYTTRARAQLNLDTRTATEYGVVRTYWSSNFEHSSGFGPSSGNLTMDFGFVQFAGFTLGKAISNFNTPWGAYTANVNSSAYIGGADNATGITQAAYTAQFGNGVSASIGVEDNTTIQRAPVLNASAGLGAAYLFTGSIGAATFTPGGLFGNGGARSPDFVGNIRIDQAAFTAQLSGAVHNVTTNYYGANETTGHPDDKWGWAISGGLLLKNLPTGPGDKFSVDATYTEGAPKYVVGGTVGNSYYSFGSSDVGYQSFASGALLDGVYATGTSLELTKVWGVRASYLHNWSPNWETGVFGGYTHVDYNGNATGIIQTALGIPGYNPDFNIWQIGTRTAWTPVQNLTFSAEVLYTRLETNNSGTVTVAANPTGWKPAGTYEFKDQDMISGNLRVRRTF
ncbi:hypothetical protein V1291_001695 [Nitrobacteraceae bacterium AZCC 1564]